MTPTPGETDGCADTELAAFGAALNAMISRAIAAYATEFPDAALGLTLEVQEGTTRLQLVVTVGGNAPSDIRVLALTENRDVLQIARMTVAAAP
jgi:hypothetical protein